MGTEGKDKMRGKSTNKQAEIKAKPTGDRNELENLLKCLRGSQRKAKTGENAEFTRSK